MLWVFVGSNKYKQIWVKGKVETWVAGVNNLEIFARALLQTA